MSWALILLLAGAAPATLAEYPDQRACESALQAASFSIDLGASWQEPAHFAKGARPGAMCLPNPKQTKP